MDKRATIFTLPEERDGSWYISEMRGKYVIKGAYFKTKEEATWERTKWVNQFWGNTLN